MEEKKKVIPTEEELKNARKSALEIEAEEEMLRRTEEQLKLREKLLEEKAKNKANEVIQNNPKPKQIKIEKDYDSQFDLVPIPSKGLIYPEKKDKFKISFLNAKDENILTSPHLVESGEFMNIIMERKILENISYKNLHTGDRNAIMIWLRATAYGNMYPVQVINPNTGELIETEIDLSDLKMIHLKDTPDEEGFFKFTFPISNSECKFKLLTVGDIEDIEKYNEEQEKNEEYTETITYRLKKQIVEIDGNDDRKYIDNFIDKMRIGDSRAFRKHNNEIESGIDLNVTIEVPGGEPFTTFLPLGFDFFWPQL